MKNCCIYIYLIVILFHSDILGEGIECEYPSYCLIGSVWVVMSLRTLHFFERNVKVKPSIGSIKFSAWRNYVKSKKRKTIIQILLLNAHMIHKLSLFDVKTAVEMAII